MTNTTISKRHLYTMWGLMTALLLTVIGLSIKLLVLSPPAKTGDIVTIVVEQQPLNIPGIRDIIRERNVSGIALVSKMGELRAYTVDDGSEALEPLDLCPDTKTPYINDAKAVSDTDKQCKQQLGMRTFLTAASNSSNCYYCAANSETCHRINPNRRRYPCHSGGHSGWCSCPVP